MKRSRSVTSRGGSQARMTKAGRRNSTGAAGSQRSRGGKRGGGGAALASSGPTGSASGGGLPGDAKGARMVRKKPPKPAVTLMNFFGAKPTARADVPSAAAATTPAAQAAGEAPADAARRPGRAAPATAARRGSALLTPAVSARTPAEQLPTTRPFARAPPAQGAPPATAAAAVVRTPAVGGAPLTPAASRSRAAAAVLSTPAGAASAVQPRAQLHLDSDPAREGAESAGARLRASSSVRTGSGGRGRRRYEEDENDEGEDVLWRTSPKRKRAQGARQAARVSRATAHNRLSVSQEVSAVVGALMGGAPSARVSATTRVAKSPVHVHREAASNKLRAPLDGLTAAQSQSQAELAVAHADTTMPFVSPSLSRSTAAAAARDPAVDRIGDTACRACGGGGGRCSCAGRGSGGGVTTVGSATAATASRLTGRRAPAARSTGRAKDVLRRAGRKRAAMLFRSPVGSAEPPGTKATSTTAAAAVGVSAAARGEGRGESRASLQVAEALKRLGGSTGLAAMATSPPQPPAPAAEECLPQRAVGSGDAVAPPSGGGDAARETERAAVAPVATKRPREEEEEVPSSHVAVGGGSEGVGAHADAADVGVPQPPADAQDTDMGAGEAAGAAAPPLVHKFGDGDGGAWFRCEVRGARAHTTPGMPPMAEQVVDVAQLEVGGATLEMTQARAIGRVVLRGEWALPDIAPGMVLHLVGDLVDVTDDDVEYWMDLPGSSRAVAVEPRRRAVAVLHPQLLLAPTRIGASMDCLRRGVLDERVRQSGTAGYAAVLGNFKHELFQRALALRDRRARGTGEGATEAALMSVARELVSGARALLSIYAVDSEVDKVRDELLAYVPAVMGWLRVYWPDEPRDGRSGAVDVGGGHYAKMRVQSLVATEEALASPILGLKGFIDVTLTADVEALQGGSGGGGRRRRVLLPLELKTGRHESTAHRAQVLLYAVMAAEAARADADDADVDTDLDPDVGVGAASLSAGVATGAGAPRTAGLLLYLRDKVSSMSGVPVIWDEVRGILSARNRLAAAFIAARARVNETVARSASTGELALAVDRTAAAMTSPKGGAAAAAGAGAATPTPGAATTLAASIGDADAGGGAEGSVADFGRLPEVIRDAHMCSRCSQVQACALFHVAEEGGNEASSGLGPTFTDLTSHLTEERLRYFRKWSRLLALEEAAVVARNDAGGSAAHQAASRPLSVAEAAADGEGGGVTYTFERRVSMRVSPAKRRARGSPRRSTTGRASLLDLDLAVGDRVWVSAAGSSVVAGTGEVVSVGGNRIAVHTTRPLARTRGASGVDAAAGDDVPDIESLGAGLRGARGDGGDGGASPAAGILWRVHRSTGSTYSLQMMRGSLVDLMCGEPVDAELADDAAADALALPATASSAPGYEPMPGMTAADVDAAAAVVVAERRLPTAGDRRLLRLLVDGAPPRFDAARQHAVSRLLWPESASSQAGGAGSGAGPTLAALRDDAAQLNDDQRRAVLHMSATRDYACVVGLPGTGKTTTMAVAIRALVMSGRSVLVTAYTHSAVDTLVRKLLDKGCDVLRLGRPHNVHADVRGCTLDAVARREGLSTVAALSERMASARVVAATCLAVASDPLFERRVFDCCIVDEASQLTEPVCLAPMRRARATVLVGDDRQLAPLVVSPTARGAGLAVSLFERLATAHPACTAVLAAQYRMNLSIQAVSNAVAYADAPSGGMRCGSDAVATHRLALPHAQCLPVPARKAPSTHDWARLALAHPRHAVVFLDTDGVRGGPVLERLASDAAGGAAAATDSAADGDVDVRRVDSAKSGTGVVNDVEASIVAQLARACVACGVAARDIGVISPYRSQLRLIRSLLHSDRGFVGDAACDAVEVDTVDRYQGRDKEVVLLSLVRSNAARETGTLLDDVRRINVAVSRAKALLVVVGSASTLDGGASLRPMLSLLRERGWLMPLPRDADSLYAAPGSDAAVVQAALKRASIGAPSTQTSPLRRRGAGAPTLARSQPAGGASTTASSSQAAAQRRRGGLVPGAGGAAARRVFGLSRGVRIGGEADAALAETQPAPVRRSPRRRQQQQQQQQQSAPHGDGVGTGGKGGGRATGAMSFPGRGR